MKIKKMDIPVDEEVKNRNGNQGELRKRKWN